MYIIKYHNNAKQGSLKTFLIAIVDNLYFLDKQVI